MPDKKQVEYNDLSMINKSMDYINSIFLGHPELVRLLMIGAISSGHVLLDDVPGVGKTTLAKAMAESLGLSFKRVQFTSDIMPSDITGGAFPVYKMGVIESTDFRPGPVFTQVLLADEINRAPPRTQSSLLEAMAEKQVSVDGTTLKLPDPFWVIATQNPDESHGVFNIPDSQLDRFLFKLKIGYPPEIYEKELFSLNNKVKYDAPTADENLIKRVSSYVNSQHVSKPAIDYLYKLVSLTRSYDDVLSGLSPRSGISIMKAAQAESWLSGRDFVSSDDITMIFINAAAHRISVKPGVSVKSLLEKIISDSSVDF